VHDLGILESLGVVAYKTGADDLTNIPLQKAIARLGKPMFVSTGMSEIHEVAETVNAIRSEGNEDIVLFHTVSNYPVHDLSAINLRAMKTMEKALHVNVGYSDHTTTMSAPVAAVALGAVVYERHFTLDKKLPCPDAALSADPAEMAEIVRLIRETEEMRGDGVKRCSHVETDMRKDTRKSIVVTRPVRKGEKYGYDNLGIKRPGYGLAPKLLDSIIGKKAQSDLPEDTVLSWDRV
jgi:sialic acid synthase SpsE